MRSWRNNDDTFLFVNMFTVCDVIVNVWRNVSFFAKILKTVMHFFKYRPIDFKNAMLKKQKNYNTFFV
jgi:hypothetical protein